VAKFVVEKRCRLSFWPQGSAPSSHQSLARFLAAFRSSSRMSAWHGTA